MQTCLITGPDCISIKYSYPFCIVLTGLDNKYSASIKYANVKGKEFILAFIKYPFVYRLCNNMRKLPSLKN